MFGTVSWPAGLRLDFLHLCAKERGLIGGTGNDTVNARQSGRQDDRVDCGPGKDTVLTDDTTEDIIAGNREVIRRG